MTFIERVGTPIQFQVVDYDKEKSLEINGYLSNVIAQLCRIATIIYHWGHQFNLLVIDDSQPLSLLAKEQVIPIKKKPAIPTPQANSSNSWNRKKLRSWGCNTRHYWVKAVSLSLESAAASVHPPTCVHSQFSLFFYKYR